MSHSEWSTLNKYIYENVAKNIFVDISTGLFYFPNDYKQANFVSRESRGRDHYGLGRCGGLGEHLSCHSCQASCHTSCHHYSLGRCGLGEHLSQHITCWHESRGRTEVTRRLTSSGATRRRPASSPGLPPSSLTAPGSAEAPSCPQDTSWPRPTARRTPGTWTSS